MQIHTALPMVRLGGIEGVDPLFLPKYKIGRSLQHAVMTSAASSKKGTQPRRSNNAMTAKRSAKPHDRRQLHIVLLTVLAASTGYTGKVSAQVYVNSDSTENCVEILGDSSQTSFIHSASNDKCKPDFTQTEYSLFYDYRNLVLGGSLYVNEGKLRASRYFWCNLFYAPRQHCYHEWLGWHRFDCHRFRARFPNGREYQRRHCSTGTAFDCDWYYGPFAISRCDFYRDRCIHYRQFCDSDR